MPFDKNTVTFFDGIFTLGSRTWSGIFTLGKMRPGSRSNMRTVVILNQKPQNAIFRAQHAGLSVGHFNAYLYSLNFNIVCSKPHLLVCSLPEMVFSYLCGQ